MITVKKDQLLRMFALVDADGSYHTLIGVVDQKTSGGTLYQALGTRDFSSWTSCPFGSIGVDATFLEYQVKDVVTKLLQYAQAQGWLLVALEDLGDFRLLRAHPKDRLPKVSGKQRICAALERFSRPPDVVRARDVPNGAFLGDAVAANFFRFWRGEWAAADDSGFLRG